MIKKSVILCVDDEQMILNALKSHLQRRFSDHYDFEFAESAEEALEVVDELYNDGYTIPLIICDQIMPGMMGDEFLIEIHHSHPDIIKIMLTGQAGLESAMNAVNNANLYRYLTKPWNEEDLLLSVEKALEQHGLLNKLREKNLELAMTNKELAKQKQQALAASHAKSRFLGIMSHELRTPLNHIINFSEILQDDLKERGLDEFIADLHHIEKSGKDLLAIVSNVLDVTSAVAENPKLDLQAIPVRNMLQVIIEPITAKAITRHNVLTVAYADNMGDMITDENRVRTIIENILDNACKFTENGHINVKVTRERRDDTEWIELIIADTGMGIDEEQQARIFHPFCQADESTTRKHGGVGLGLALAQINCLALGGKINLQSKMGEGSTFKICFPVNIT